MSASSQGFALTLTLLALTWFLGTWAARREARVRAAARSHS